MTRIGNMAGNCKRPSLYLKSGIILLVRPRERPLLIRVTSRGPRMSPMSTALARIGSILFTDVGVPSIS